MPLRRNSMPCGADTWSRKAGCWSHAPAMNRHSSTGTRVAVGRLKTKLVVLRVGMPVILTYRRRPATAARGLWRIGRVRHNVRMNRAPAKVFGLSRRASLWLAVSLLLWFNLSILPCALAAGQAHACPGCPTQQQHEEHAQHGGMSHGADEHGHECSWLETPCCTPDTQATVTKPSKFETQGFDLGPDAWIEPEPWYLALHGLAPADHRCPTGPPPGLAALPRLHVLNCVYLN